jgi:DNA invertase Pin-like site-specific DNA recombinase
VTGHDKILAEHRERRAFVYARQSTPAQVLQHHSSTERQIGLGDLAAKLGWSDALIDVVTDDLGQSGRYIEGREGFQRMATEMTLGRVGAVFSVDASRLARSSADWHRLLEVAALTRTLLVDEQSVYDPRDPNDRLVLGMKGTMADFELVWLRQRMEGGKWHLARKGAYRVRPAAGYIYEDEEATSLTLDPDEEVQRSVALLFERYRIGGTAHDVVEHFATHKLRFPARFGKTVNWVRLSSSRVHDVLSNPMYTGTYVFGRSSSQMILDEGRRRRRVTALPISDWKVSLRGAHPAYISWEEFMANHKRMAENAARTRGTDNVGAAREGRALLQGLLICGRCGARVSVRYAGQNGRWTNYSCTRLEWEALSSSACLHVAARNLETPIVDVVMKALTHERLLDATRIVDTIEEQDKALDKQWLLRLEKARYEAKRAERQYDACDPDNRVVARTLEKRWNDKLAAIEELEREYETFKTKLRPELSDLDRQRILQLADDLPKLWRAATTTNRDRKLLLRNLIEAATVSKIDVPKSALRVRLLWRTGAVTELEIDLIGPGDSRRPIPYRVLELRTPVPGQALSSSQ